MSGVFYTKGPNLLTDDELYPGWVYYISRQVPGEFSGTAKFVKLSPVENAPVFTDLKPDSENQFVSFGNYVNREFQISANSGRVYNTVPNFVPVVAPNTGYTKGDICLFDDMLWPNRVYFIQGDGVAQFSGLAKFAGLNNGLRTAEFTDLIPDENNRLATCSQYAPGTNLRFGVSLNSGRIYVAIPVEPPAEPTVAPPVAPVTTETKDIPATRPVKQKNTSWGLFYQIFCTTRNNYCGGYKESEEVVLAEVYPTKAEAMEALEEHEVHEPDLYFVRPLKGMVHGLDYTDPHGVLPEKAKAKKPKLQLTDEEIKTKKLQEEERLLKIREEERKKEVARQEAIERERLESERMIKEIQEAYECLD